MGRCVVANANPLPVSSLDALHERFIAADVGGTHVRIGLVQGSGDPAHPVTVLQYRKYVCAQYPGLTEIIEDFLCTLEGENVGRGVIASAGYPLEDGTVITANLPWRLSPQEIRERLGFREFRLVNDFEAVACATHYLRASECVLLPGDAEHAAQGPTLIVGPGTGLGAAVRIPGNRHPLVLATEAGQASLAPGNELEIEILRILMRHSTHVSNETALSGPGLVQIYNALCSIRGVPPVLRAPASITEAALGAHDALAIETLNLFCAWLGSVVGDLALSCGARGGVHLAGGIL